MKQKNNTLITILLALSCLVIAVTGTFAAYNRTGYVKRVVSTEASSSQVERFSSNYLELCDIGTESSAFTQKSLYVGSGDVSIGITVCNYPQSDMTKYASNTISYEFKVRLLDSEGKEPATAEDINKLIIKYKNSDGSLGTAVPGPTSAIIGELAGGTSNSDLYTLTCDSEDVAALAKYSISVEATPLTPLGSQKKLAANLKFATSTSQITQWDGGFIEEVNKDANGHTTIPDAFNYEITGSGPATIELKINETLSMTKESLGALKAIKVDDTISFDVGGENQPTYYLLQFYRNSDSFDPTITWDMLKGYVGFKFYPRTSP